MLVDRKHIVHLIFNMIIYKVIIQATNMASFVLKMNIFLISLAAFVYFCISYLLVLRHN